MQIVDQAMFSARTYSWQRLEWVKVLGWPQPFRNDSHAGLVTLSGTLHGDTALAAQTTTATGAAQHWRAASTIYLVPTHTAVRLPLLGEIAVLQGNKERFTFSSECRQVETNMSVVVRGWLCQRQTSSQARYRTANVSWCIKATGPNDTIDIACVEHPRMLPLADVMAVAGRPGTVEQP